MAFFQSSKTGHVPLQKLYDNLSPSSWVNCSESHVKTLDLIT